MVFNFIKIIYQKPKSKKSRQIINFEQNLKMKITITDGNAVSNFDVDNDQLVEDVKALVQVQMGVPIQRSQLLYNGKLLKNNQKLSQAGVTDGGLLFLTISNVQQPIRQAQQPKKGLGLANLIKTFDKQVKQQGGFKMPQADIQSYMRQAETTIQQISSDEPRLAHLSQVEPQIFQCIIKKDIKGLANIMKMRKEEKLKQYYEKQRKFFELSKDPMNPQYQKMLQQRIHQKNIQKNYQFAQEYIPEVFGKIHMLYINARVNKVPIQAFVDSGAQSTIMSQSLAQRCGLMRLVDKRYSGVAAGVGTCKILGRIHSADIEIEGKFLTCAFTVIQNNSTQFLLGLDMLKRFSCMIDLKNHQLVFQDGIITTKFLHESQIKKNSRPELKKQDVEPMLKKLAEMGFTRQESLATLQTCNYNYEVASNILMQRKYGK